MKYLSAKDYNKLVSNLRQGFILVGAVDGDDDPKLDDLVNGRIASLDVGLDPEEALRSAWQEISKAIENLHTFARANDAEKPASVTIRTMTEAGHKCRVLPIWAANGPVRKAIDLARAVFTDRLVDALAGSKIVADDWWCVRTLAGEIADGTTTWTDEQCVKFGRDLYSVIIGALVNVA